MLDVNVPDNFKRIRTGFDKIIRKLKNNFPCLHSRTCIRIFCRIGKTFEAEPIKFPWHGFYQYSTAASQLLKYTVQFIFIINFSTVSSTNFVWSILQDSVNFNFTHYICLSTGFLVDNNAGQNQKMKQINKREKNVEY